MSTEPLTLTVCSPSVTVSGDELTSGHHTEEAQVRKLTTILAVIAAMVLSTGVASATSHCIDAGTTGLTANYVNEVPDGSLDVSCDIGIYFDEDAAVDGVELHGTVGDARSVQYGIYVDGAAVDIADSSVTVEAGYPHQFVSVTYRNGASGTFDGNVLSGAHRAALVIRGAGTDVRVKSNTVTGSGPKATGWAENGIQVDQGATATITSNTISDHWWDKNDFVSSGLLAYEADGVTAHRNTFTDNDANITVLGGDGGNFHHNRIDVDAGGKNADAYGVIVFSGDGHGFRQNTLTAEGGSVGLYNAGTRTKLIRNSFSGWAYSVVDDGTGTVYPKPFQQ